MQFGEIEFPNDLCRAIENGDVVIFAGAGISRPSPSGLPLFDELATMVASGTGIKREARKSNARVGRKQSVELEPVDRFLGRLEKAQVGVKEITRGILTANTQPNELHSSIVRIFPNADKLRIVTTNFDNHLSTSIAQSYDGRQMGHYVSPALPLGNDFSGIVYLHGSAHHRMQDCILTDGDFGRAYLTDGWVRRFLVSMFEQYPVLFVGYSHNDPVMNYLSRGLPVSRQRPRYALVPEGEEAQWHFLDIQPLVYPLRTDENKHVALVESLSACAEHFQTDVVQKVRNLKAYATGNPPIDKGRIEDLKFALSDPVFAKPFLEAAQDGIWLTWFEDHHLLRPLFRPDEQVETLDLIAGWFAHQITLGNSPSLHRIVERQGTTSIHPTLCSRICHVLRFRRVGIAANDQLRWLTILLAQPHTRVSKANWAWLLELCQSPGCQSLFGPLLDRASTFDIKLQQSRNWDDAASEPPRLSINLSLSSDVIHILADSWKDSIKPNFEHSAERVLSIVGNRLADAHALMAVYKQEHYFSCRRTAIAPHSDDRYGRSEGIHLLVNMGRDTLQFLQERKSTASFHWIQSWITAPSFLLVRIAIHALANEPSLSPDAKLRILLDQRLLYVAFAKPEVYFLLKNAYSLAGVSLRSELLAEIEATESLPIVQESPDQFTPHQRISLLRWLIDSAPACGMAADAFTRGTKRWPDIPTAVPPDLLPRIRTRFRSVETDFDAEAILDNDPAQFIEMMRQAIDKQSQSMGYEPKPVEKLRSLISMSPRWGIRCHRLLREHGGWGRDVWNQVCFAWREADLEAEDWRELCMEILSPDTPAELWEYMDDVLEAWFKKCGGALPSDFAKFTDEIAARSWRECLSSSQKVDEDASHSDWLNIALNRPGSSYAEYWMLRLEQIRKQSNDAMSSIPDNLKSALSEVVHGTSGAAEMGSVMVAAQVRWLNQLDKEFVTNHVIPLFNWNRDERRAEQCWHGFLYWGSWDRKLLPALLPFFNEAIHRAHKMVLQAEGHVVERLAVHLALLAFEFVDRPLTKDWLLHRLREFAPDQRVAFANAMYEFIEDAPPAKVKRRWKRWISDYLKARIQGSIALDVAEATVMARWLLRLVHKSGEGLEHLKPLVAKGDLSTSGWLHEIERLELHLTHADATLAFVQTYLESMPEHFGMDETFRNIWAELGKHFGSDLLHPLKVALVKLKCDPDQLP